MGFREKELARSARDAHLHEALFLPGGLEDGTELGYYTKNLVGTPHLLSLHFTRLLNIHLASFVEEIYDLIFRFDDALSTDVDLRLSG